jgi:hypothetical protein
MNEINHNTLRYSGPAGEQAVVKVEAKGTTQLVEYTLDGITKKLDEGADITFSLVKKPGDEPVNLQLVLDYNANGSYVVTVMNVTDCVNDTEHDGTCMHNWLGPPLAIKDFKFFAD